MIVNVQYCSVGNHQYAVYKCMLSIVNILYCNVDDPHHTLFTNVNKVLVMCFMNVGSFQDRQRKQSRRNLVLKTDH
jgi:hypothetical protein